jgi:hypothetical protein
VEQNYPSQNLKTYVQGFSPKYFTIWGRNMDTKHTTGEQMTGRSARKSRKEKFRNVTIREIMEVGKNILELIEEKRLRWFGYVKRMPGNRLPLKVLEWEPEGTRRRGRPKERWIDGVRRRLQTMD